MRIVVCVKQIFDPATVKISRSREDFDLRQAMKKTNPADRYALEAALRLRATEGGEVLALTAGDAGAEDTVREAVAMGADHGILVTGPAGLRGAGSAAAVAAALRLIGLPDLVLTGEGNPVDGSGSLPARLAALLGWPAVLDAVCLEQAAGGGVQAVVAEGHNAHAVPLPGPAVVAVAIGPERPRYPVAARIANAYQPGLVDVWPVEELGLEAGALSPDSEPGGLVLGPERTLGQTLAGSQDEAVGLVLEILRSQRVVRA